MQGQEYLKQAAITDIREVLERLQSKETLMMLHALMGMVTEVGEAMDAMKKWLIYGKPIDITNMKQVLEGKLKDEEFAIIGRDIFQWAMDPNRNETYMIMTRSSPVVRLRKEIDKSPGIMTP